MACLECWDIHYHNMFTSLHRVAKTQEYVHETLFQFFCCLVYQHYMHAIKLWDQDIRLMRKKRFSNCSKSAYCTMSFLWKFAKKWGIHIDYAPKKDCFLVCKVKDDLPSFRIFEIEGKLEMQRLNFRLEFLDNNFQNWQ